MRENYTGKIAIKKNRCIIRKSKLQDLTHKIQQRRDRY